MSSQAATHDQPLSWSPESVRIRPLRLLIAWILEAAAFFAAAWIVPGADIHNTGGAFLVVAIVAVLNAVLPPIVAALRLPYTLAAGFLLVLVLDALILRAAADIAPEALTIDDFGSALLVSLVAAAVGMALAVFAGIDDDDGSTLRIARRVARRTGKPVRTDVPGIIYLEIDGLGMPVLRRAVRDGTTPTLARWLAEGTHKLLEWETDLSSQTGASQAGILLGSNEGIPAFRWVDKSTGTMMTCSNPDDCAAIEAERATGRGLLVDGGTSRGNLLSGEADAAILTVSRLADERSPNPGYRSFLANGTNVTRTLVLFVWEIVLELIAAARQRRRDVLPRGHRGGSYPFLRAGMCVFVRDLIVYSVIQDMFRGAPAVYATFASYDEVAHHSGLERPDTLEALRKLDQRFAMIERVCRYAPRPYELVVLSDHGQTQGATFRQRNGYGLDDLVEQSLGIGQVAQLESGDEHASAMGQALDEATGRTGRDKDEQRAKNDVSGRDTIVLGSGNLGLVYLMEEPRRMTLEEINERHPDLVPKLCAHQHVGFVLARSERDGAVALGSGGLHRLADGHVEGIDPLAGFSENAARHLLRTDGFSNAPDLLVNSFYDPVTEEGCAFEELISFHGGMGGGQTQPFVLHPVTLPAPSEPLVGAADVHGLLCAWRAGLQGAPAPAPAAVEASAR